MYINVKSLNMQYDAVCIQWSSESRLGITYIYIDIEWYRYIESIYMHTEIRNTMKPGRSLWKGMTTCMLILQQDAKVEWLCLYVSHFSQLPQGKGTARFPVFRNFRSTESTVKQLLVAGTELSTPANSSNQTWQWEIHRNPIYEIRLYLKDFPSPCLIAKGKHL